MLCAWHVQQNFKKHFTFLNRLKTDEKTILYSIIINLPFQFSINNFEEDIKKIFAHPEITDKGKQYLT